MAHGGVPALVHHRVRLDLDLSVVVDDDLALGERVHLGLKIRVAVGRAGGSVEYTPNACLVRKPPFAVQSPFSPGASRSTSGHARDSVHHVVVERTTTEGEAPGHRERLRIVEPELLRGDLDRTRKARVDVLIGEFRRGHSGQLETATAGQPDPGRRAKARPFGTK